MFNWKAAVKMHAAVEAAEHNKKYINTYMRSADVNVNCMMWLVKQESQSAIARTEDQVTRLTNQQPVDCSDTKTTFQPQHRQCSCHR